MIVLDSNTWHARLYLFTRRVWKNFIGKRYDDFSYSEMTNLCAYLRTIFLYMGIVLAMNALVLSGAFYAFVWFPLSYFGAFNTLGFIVIVCAIIATAIGIIWLIYVASERWDNRVKSTEPSLISLTKQWFEDHHDDICSVIRIVETPKPVKTSESIVQDVKVKFDDPEDNLVDEPNTAPAPAYVYYAEPVSEPVKSWFSRIRPIPFFICLGLLAFSFICWGVQYLVFEDIDKTNVIGTHSCKMTSVYNDKSEHLSLIATCDGVSNPIELNIRASTAFIIDALKKEKLPLAQCNELESERIKKHSWTCEVSP